jgi:two-component system, chemotaxis family, chemotaxis protein CheY
LRASFRSYKIGDENFKMAKILIVEDDELLVKAYTRKLGMANYEVATAIDGIEGLEKAKQLKPDLILLDILMPRLNGIELLKTIKVDPELKAIPVIVLTNVASSENTEECLRAGCVSYIIKSNTIPSDVLKEIKKVLD